MNKAVHVLVYLILAVAGVALYFEMKLSEKKALLKDSNEQLRKCIVELSSYVESSNAAPALVEDKQITTDAGSLNASESGLAEPATRSQPWLPSDYKLEFENFEIGVLGWGSKENDDLHKVYAVDADGNKMSGEGPADKLIKQIVARAKAQKDVLKETRKQLTSLRLTLKELAAEYDKLPPQIRKQAYELEQKEKEIEELTDEKKKVETELDNSKKEVDDLKADVDDYKEKLKQAKEETDEMTAKYEEQKKKFDDLMKIVKNQTATPRAAAGPVAGGGQLTAGDKGTIVDVDPAFVTIKFTDSALDELIGSDRTGALPPHEMYVVRSEKGQDGKPTQKRIIVGKVRLRQWTPNSNFVLAHVLKPYSQEPLVIEKGDDVITD